MMHFYKGQALEQLAKQAYDEAKKYGYKGHQEGEVLFSSSDTPPIAFSPLKLKLLNTLEDPSKAFSSFALRPDGLVLASTDGKESIQIWDTLTGRSLRIFQIKEFLSVDPIATSIAFNTHGDVLIAGIRPSVTDSAAPTIYFFLLSILTNKPLGALHSHGGRVENFFPFAVDSGDRYYVNYPCVISYHSKLELEFLRIDPLSAILSAAMSSDTLTLLVSTQNVIEIWSQNEKPDHTVRADKIGLFKRRRIIPGHTEPIRSLAISPDGQTFASGSEDTTIKIWHLHTGKILHALSGHTGSIQSLVISSDGCVLVSGSQDRTIKMWDTHTGELIRTLDEHTEDIKQLAFSEEGRILASSDGKAIKIWGQQ